jgi:hypothetical protein
MKKFLLPLILFLSFGHLAKSQHIDVFPVFNGTELLNLLVENYKPGNILGYGPARDSMFANVDAVEDTLTGVYSSFSIYLDPSQDPTIAAYMDNGPNGMNTEHTFPRSLGAEDGNAKSDMHHLFPTRIDVNAIRGNFPFAEIEDNQTTQWYYLNQLQSSVPTENIDLYSEYKSGGFEPPEAHKGDVARAMFYFYTMYKDQADAANNSFFSNQQFTLCQWHLADPVDTKEWDRTHKIAPYQEDKPNPFVLDCTLAARTYCPGQECMTTAIEYTEDNKPFALLQNAPNPFSGSTEIRYELNQSFEVEVFLTDVLGRHAGTLVNKKQGQGSYMITVDSLEKGIWFYHLTLKGNGKVYHEVKKMVVLSH